MPWADKIYIYVFSLFLNICTQCSAAQNSHWTHSNIFVVYLYISDSRFVDKLIFFYSFGAFSVEKELIHFDNPITEFTYIFVSTDASLLSPKNGSITISLLGTDLNKDAMM